MRIEKQPIIILLILLIFLSSCNYGYYNNKLYCEKNSDCVVMKSECGSFVINNHNFNKTKEDESIAKSAFVECDSFIESINPRCEYNKCIADENVLQ